MLDHFVCVIFKMPFRFAFVEGVSFELRDSAHGVKRALKDFPNPSACRDRQKRIRFLSRAVFQPK